ncbi:MAG: hypothetical protein COS49_00730, partial [Candidatus Portnoybacteria bacterium CG03_land_8_20_14_0_80_41_10]
KISKALKRITDRSFRPTSHKNAEMVAVIPTLIQALLVLVPGIFDERPLDCSFFIFILLPPFQNFDF